MYKKKKYINKSLRNYDFNGDKITKKEKFVGLQKRAVIYCRVSSEQQKNEGYGIETQEKVARNRCKEHGIEVDAVFKDEAISGNKTDREGFNSCVEYLREKNQHYIYITHFVCRELSRISRPDLDNIGAAFELEGRIKQFGVEIVDIMGGIKDDTDEGKFVKAVHYAVTGYERKKIQKLCQNGKRGRILEGYRPFPKPPVGYKRTFLNNRDYIDEVDTSLAGAIKEGLELFANDPTMGKQQLFDFLLKKGFKTSTGKKPWITILEKMFELPRLYFYAGYCIYPQRDICELIEGKHEGIISLETAEKIKRKILKGEKLSRGIRKSDDDFILKQLITCKGCGRKLTGRTTKKYNGNLFPYYGCQYKGCPERANIPKEKLENDVLDLIKAIQLPSELISLFDNILEKTYSNKESDLEKELIEKQKRIEQIDIEKEKIENFLLNEPRDSRLYDKMNEKRSNIDYEQRNIQELIENRALLKIDRRKRSKKIKELMSNPLSFREYGDKSLKKLLISVRFGDSLFYSKSQGLQTNDSLVLYTLLRDFSQNNTLIYQGWDSNPHDREVTRFGV